MNKHAGARGSRGMKNEVALGKTPRSDRLLARTPTVQLVALGVGKPLSSGSGKRSAKAARRGAYS